MLSGSFIVLAFFPCLFLFVYFYNNKKITILEIKITNHAKI